MPAVKRITLLMHPQDNVASALEALGSSATVPVEHEALPQPLQVQLTENIPLGHKFALRDIGVGEKVVKFGMVIGTATTPIARGAHVSEHNLE